MAKPASPIVRRRELATMLRRLRVRARLTLEEAARHIEVSAATLSRIETGLRIPRARDVRDLVRFYGVTDDDRVDEILELVAEAKEPGWWEAYTEVDEEYATLIGLEVSATRIQHYEGLVLPGVLQTPEYARAYLEQAISPGRDKPLSSLDIENRIEVRVRRNRGIVEPPGIPYEAIIDEAVLRRKVGGSDVTKRQILALVEMSRLPHVSIRLLPFDIGGHPGQPSGFMIVTMPQADIPDVVYMDTLAGQLFLEDPDDLDRHRRVWDVLHRSALDEEATREALLGMASGEHS